MLTFIEACATIKSTIHAATNMIMRTIVMCSFYTCCKWALIKIAHLNNSFILLFMLIALFTIYISTKRVFYLLYTYSHNKGSATQQNRVRDYVIFEILPRLHLDYTGITPGLLQVCTEITHIRTSVFRLIIANIG